MGERLRRIRSRADDHAGETAVFALAIIGIALLLYLLPPPVSRLCLFVGVVGLGYHTFLTGFEIRDAELPWPVSIVPDLGLFVAPVAVALTVYTGTTRVTLTQLVILGALFIVFFYFWFVLPAAWYHSVWTSKSGRPPSPESSLSVIVPAYNESGYIGPCIDSLVDADYPRPMEIIVVDDGSTDSTYEEARAHATEEVTVLQQSNGGKHAALNTGLDYATGDAVMTVDADSLVAEDAPARIVADLESDPDVGAVAGTVKLVRTEMFVEKLQALEYAIAINTFRRAFAALGLVNVVPGCLGCFRRDALEAVGRFTDDTLTEDFDVTLELLKAGWKVRASEALVYTRAPSTWHSLYRQRIRWRYGNIETLRKHADVLWNERVNNFAGLVFPYQVVSLVVLPLATAVILWTIFVELAAGRVAYIAALLLLFTGLQFLATLFALVSDDTDVRLLVYVPVIVTVYKLFIDTVTIKALVDILRQTDQTWGHYRPDIPGMVENSVPESTRSRNLSDGVKEDDD